MLLELFLVVGLVLIVGTATLFTEVRMDRATQVFNFPALLLAISLLVFMLITDRRISRREGGVLLGSYGVYVVGVVLIAIYQSSG